MSERGQAKHDAGKARYSLIPVGFVAGIARVLTWGASKPGYSDHGWQRVDRAKERYYDALQRHLDTWRAGERYDTGEGGTGEHHLLCAATNVAILWWHDTVGGQCDAEAPAPPKGGGGAGAAEIKWWPLRLPVDPQPDVWIGDPAPVDGGFVTGEPLSDEETATEAAKVLERLRGG